VARHTHCRRVFCSGTRNFGHSRRQEKNRQVDEEEEKGRSGNGQEKHARKRKIPLASFARDEQGKSLRRWCINSEP
jgi:hypothetical protein